MSLTLLIKVAHPEAASTVMTVPAKTTLASLKSQAGAALTMDLTNYTATYIKLGEDACPLGHVDPLTMTLETLLVENKTVIFYGAPAELKPLMIPKKCVRGDEEDEDEEEDGEAKAKKRGQENPYKHIKLSECVDLWTEVFKDSKKVKERALYFNFLEIYFVECFKSSPKSFAKLSREQMKELLSSNNVNASEADLFNGLKFWGEKNCPDFNKGKGKDSEEKREETSATVLRAFIGDDLLNLIRFPLMTPFELASYVVPANLLDRNVVLSLFSFSSSMESTDDPTGLVVNPKKLKLIAQSAGLSMFNLQKREPRLPPDFFAFDPLSKHSQLTLSGDYLKLSSSSTSYYMPCAGNITFKDGVHQWEFVVGMVHSHNYSLVIGVCPATFTNWSGSVILGYSGHIPGHGYALYDGTKFFGGQQGKVGNGAKIGDTVTVIMDCDKGDMSVLVNGKNVNPQNKPLYSNINYELRPCVSMYGSSSLTIVPPKVRL